MIRGELTGVPEEVVERMLECQALQGNLRNVKVFERHLGASKFTGGFHWEETSEGESFWRRVLGCRDYDVFFDKYPKKSYPRVMMVSDDVISGKNPGVPRVVFAEKNGYFISWRSATTMKEAEEQLDTTFWCYAAEVPKEEPTTSNEDIIIIMDFDEVIMMLSQLRRSESK